MRYTFLMMLLSVQFTLHAQTAKTIPGVFIYGINNSKLAVSSSGNSVAINYGYNSVVLMDIIKGTMIQLNRNMINISADHRYLFKNDSYVHRQGENNKSRWAFNTSSIGTLADTIMRTISGFHALAMDEQGNYIASRVWNDSSNWHTASMAGIYKVDRITGNILQTLRTDTFYTCTDRNGCYFQGFYVQKNYFAYSPRTNGLAITIYPFGKKEIITIPEHSYHTVETDGDILYTVGDSTIDFRIVTAFDTRTGKQIARKIYSRPANAQDLFKFSGGSIFHFDSKKAVVEEDKIVNGMITTLHSWNINTTLNLQADQFWNFAVMKGPSFFFAPIDMPKGEAGGEQTNNAIVFNPLIGKVNLKVYPFFNRNAGDIAKQQADDKSSKDFSDKIAREKAAEKKRKDDLCNPALGVGGYKKGFTVIWASQYRIVASYDCARDEYKLWTPVQPNASIYEQTSSYVVAPGNNFRQMHQTTYYQYYTCKACDGDGHFEVTEYTTKTKDLPWGYFSGIETKKITTTSTTKYKTCNVCNGQGVVLK